MNWNNSSVNILKAGLLVGTLDITAACLNTWIVAGKGPEVVLKFVASGVFGREEAFAGGWGMAAMGLLFHYLIALSFTWFFFRIFPKVKTWVPNWILLGVLYGVFVWVVMNRLVVPLSNTPKGPFNLQSALINAGILIVCIGLPLAYMASRQKVES